MQPIKDDNKNSAKWIVGVLASTFLCLSLVGMANVVIDPFFHYHKPLSNLEYPIDNERYQNDGIVRHFEYDTIITGSSMTENFKTSECNEIFGVNAIKVPFSGARYKEINDNLKRAFKSENKIKNVIRCLDYSFLVMDKDAMKEDAVYPTYLYNDNLFDDVSYVFNKTIAVEDTYRVCEYTERGGKTTSFDDYSSWNSRYTFGKDVVLGTYSLGTRVKKEKPITGEQLKMVRDNIRQNVVGIAVDNPETTFYIYFSPYSICSWDELDSEGTINQMIDAEKCAIEEILECDNIKLFSFTNNFKMVCNLDNYKDQAHYGEWINTKILKWMKNDEYRLTKENYNEYVEEIREFYSSYDYSSLHVEDK